MRWKPTLVREAYRREIFPERMLWWMAAEGMRDFFRTIAKGLAGPLGRDQAGSRELLATLGKRMFERRYDALASELAKKGRALPDRARDPRAVPLLMGALYRVSSAPKSAWVLGDDGGPRSPLEALRARRMLFSLSAKERWFEVATHLGELLVVLTEDLPTHLPHARKVLGDICFESGVLFATRAKKAFDIPDDVADPPRVTMEILRMSEYVFRVNPEHWSSSDTVSGSLEGNACPWYTRPGWNGAHCGIFGQFQSGVSSVFGLRYHLAKTIPKHGGGTCRIDLKPIPLGKKPAAASPGLVGFDLVGSSPSMSRFNAGCAPSLTITMCAPG